MAVTLIVVLAVFVYFADRHGPAVYPTAIGRGITDVVGAVALVVSLLTIPISPAAYPDHALVFGVLLVVLSTVPPVLGLVEARTRPDGEAIFSTGRTAGQANRFPAHLITNVIGALCGLAFLAAAGSTPGVDDFIDGYEDSWAFNIVLPVSGLVVYLFVRAQQLDACPDIDERAKGDDWERHVVGYSLRHWHQLTNVVYLILATFTASTTVLYLFAFTIDRFEDGDRLALSWQLLIAMVLVLVFVLVCGVPSHDPDQAVHFTFLTGTPAVLVAILVWFAMLQDETSRDVAAFVVLGSGYVAYCVLAILGERRKGNFQVHYFAGLGMALVLALLLTSPYLGGGPG